MQVSEKNFFYEILMFSYFYNDHFDGLNYYIGYKNEIKRDKKCIRKKGQLILKIVFEKIFKQSFPV